MANGESKTWLEKNIETPTIHTLKMVKRLSLAEVISEVSEKVQDHSDEESSVDEGDGINGYLGALFFFTGEQWNSWKLWPFSQHTKTL